jgi:uncharacterized protein (TIGR03437 family)
MRTVANAAPGAFTQDTSGQVLGMIANADSSTNSRAYPAARGSLVTISATGEGQTNPTGVDGQVTLASGVPNQPAGYFQVVAQVSDGAPSGDAIPSRNHDRRSVRPGGRHDIEYNRFPAKKGRP